MDQMCARARRPRCDESHGMGASSTRRASRIVPVDRARYALGERPARARVLVSSLVDERAVRGDDAREERGKSRARVPLDSRRGLMSEIPIVIGLLYGFDGSGHWINHVLIDRYVLGVSKPGDCL